jgi:glucoamylase
MTSEAGRRDPAPPPFGKAGLPVTEVVSPDALALVRFGLRVADDPRIVATVKAIDATLRVETPRGPSWRRYNGDGYGEHDDGAPFIKGGGTRGRAWPLLTGERAHYELAAGRREEAARLLHAMESLAGDSGMIPEQVWDADDLPGRCLFRGRPTGSAMPLAWAHAEYLTLRRSLAAGRPVDRPPQAAHRYLERKVDSEYVVWRADHRQRRIPPGKTLRIEVTGPAVIRWASGDRTLARDVATRDTTLGVHVADLPTRPLSPGARVRIKIDGPGLEHRDTEEFEVEIAER